MKKIIILIVILTFNLSAEYLMTYNGSNYCVDTYSINDSNSNIDVIFSSNKTSYNLDVDVSDFLSGYKYISNTCNKIEILTYLGLSFENYNFLIALVALFSGFSTLFFMIYISIEVAKK